MEENLFRKISELGLTDDFTNSLKQQFKEKKYLTKKQIQCLETRISNYQEAQELIQYKYERDPTNSFVCSLKKQFEESGYLTHKQLEALNDVIADK